MLHNSKNKNFHDNSAFEESSLKKKKKKELFYPESFIMCDDI